MANDSIGEIVSCDSLYMAKVITDNEEEYVAGIPEYLAPLGEVKHDPKVTSASSDYDGDTMFNYYTEAGEDTLSISGLSERRKAQITGKSYDPATGRIYDSGDLSKMPKYAVGYRIEVGDGKYIYRWFLKGNFKIGATTAKSKGQKVEPQKTELSFIPLNTIHKWQVPDPDDFNKTMISSQKATVADTSDPNFTTAENWFSQVQTPTLSGKPDALTVSCSLANTASGVAAGTAPVLTFNNRIDNESVSMIAGSTGAIVAVSKAFDATEKILTITPAATLSSATTYYIVVAGVKDIFGQTLAQSTIKFTTA